MRPPASGPRILMTTDAVGGVLAYSATLARALAARGCRIHVVVMGPPPRPDQLQAFTGVDGIKLEITDMALEWLDPCGQDLPGAQSRAASIARNVAPDLVHLNSYREAQFEWRAPVLIVAHSCVSSWWRACHGADPDEPRWRRYRAGVAAGLAAADTWVTPTAAHGEVVRALHRPPSAGRVIWNGIRPLGRSSCKQNFIFAAGRLWDEAKNITVLAKAARMLDWPVRIAGPTASPDGAAACASESDVEALGDLTQTALHAAMRRAAIYAAPALYEPFGLAVAEAASAGCALLLSDIPTFRELWSGAALFVDPRDRDAVVDGCRRLIRDEALRARLQRTAAARARRYSVSAMAECYLEAYHDLTANPVAPGAPAVAAEMPA